MFYEKFLEFCKKHYVNPTQVAVGAGLHRSMPNVWKRTGITPRLSTCIKMAKYLGIPVDEVLGWCEEEPYESAD